MLESQIYSEQKNVPAEQWRSSVGKSVGVLNVGLVIEWLLAPESRMNFFATDH